MAQIYDPVVKLNELTKGIDFAMLTTIRSNGSVHSCPMATLEVDSDGIIWFFSDMNTEKVDAVRANNHVNLAYSAAGSERYVSISGTCELVRDHVKAQELWKDLYRAWFAKGIADPNLILLKVHVQEAEYWDATAGRMVPLPGFVKTSING